MSLDQAHLGLTAILWLVGLVYIALTLPKVNQVRRVAYIVALPLWAGWTAMYAYTFFTYHPRDAAFTLVEIATRVLLFGIAIEGLLVPFIDRLEVQGDSQEFRIEGEWVARPVEEDE